MSSEDGVSIVLKAAVKDIEAVMRKHDIGGVVCLSNGQGQHEWRLFLDTPTWSTVRFLGGKKEGVHFKGYMKSMPMQTQRTTNMLCSLGAVIGRCFMIVDQIEKKLTSCMDIEKGPATWTDGE